MRDNRHVTRPPTWGRWGEDDERGALNLLDGPAVLRGLAAARRGEVIPLGLPVEARGTPVTPGRPPVLHTMLVDGADFEAGARRGANGFQFADDHLSMAVHSGTHLDALSHVGRDGLLYNGIPASEVRSRSGAFRLGVDKVGGVVCRGVLLDFVAEAGAPLEAGRALGVADLERALARAGTELAPGDAVLLRTGWLADRGVVLVGADNFGVEVIPSESGETLPVHLALLQERGVYLLEMVDLVALAAAGTATFALVLAPLRITGGVGSPVNPLAVV